MIHPAISRIKKDFKGEKDEKQRMANRGSWVAVAE